MIIVSYSLNFCFYVDMSVEVAAGDVAKVILQFCRENGLVRSVETLQV